MSNLYLYTFLGSYTQTGIPDRCICLSLITLQRHCFSCSPSPCLLWDAPFSLDDGLAGKWRKQSETDRYLRKQQGRPSSLGQNLNFSTSTLLGVEFRIHLRWMTAQSLGQISRYISIHRSILTNRYSPDFNISQPLSAMLKKPVSPTPQAPELQSPTLTQPPPSLLLRLVPQLRPVSQAVPPDSQAYPLEAPQSPRNSILTVSVMIAMPSPPPVNPQNSSEDTFPPVLVGVIHQPVPHGWPIDAKSESG